MELKILWMYHDVMDLYGDKGNIAVLKKRCERRGIAVQIDTCGMGEMADMCAYDLIFMGGGADKEQSLLYQDLIKRKEQVQAALESGSFILLICGGYQLFGKYYVDAFGNQIEGLGLFPYYTNAAADNKRCIGNVLIEANLDGERVEVIGFENHGGQSEGVTQPFGKVIIGHGNVFHGIYEGFYNGQVLGTYLHGPLLPKNAKLADHILKKALKKRYGEVTLAPLDDTWENKAFAAMKKRLIHEK